MEDKKGLSVGSHLVGQVGPITLIIAAFLALGVWYSQTIPLFEAPLEPWHYLQVEHFAGDRPSPALTDLRATWGKEEHRIAEPPLYYLIGSLIVRKIEISSDQIPYRPNPWATLGDANALGNRNAILHLASLESPPYEGVAEAVHRLRLFSLGCAALSLVAIYGLVLALLPGRKEIALGTTALAAFTPGFLFASSAVNNTALTTFGISFTLYAAAHTIRGTRPQALWNALLGLGTILAIFSGWSGLAALAIAIATYFLRPSLPKPLRGQGHLGQMISLVIATGAAIAWGIYAWWQKVPFGASRIERVVPHSGRGILDTLGDVLASYWGIFGWHNVLAEPWFYSLGTVLLILCVGGGGLYLITLGWLGMPARRRLKGVFPLPGICLAAVALVAWARTGLRAWPQGALFYPAIGPMSLLLYGGLSAWAQKWHPRLVAGALAAILGATAGLVPEAFIKPVYAQPTRFSLEDLPPDIRALDLAYGDDLFLLGYGLEQESVTVGKTLRLRLYWTTRKRVETDYYFTVFLLGPDSSLIGQVKSFPGRGNYSTRLWLPGEFIVDNYEVRVSADAQAPAAASIRLSVDDWGSQKSLEPVDYQGQPLGPTPQLAVVRLAPPYSPLYRLERSVGASFDRRIKLEGYTIWPSHPSIGLPWEVRLVWKALRRVSLDYTVFVHLMDAEGNLVAQADSPPLEGHYPTSLWRVGEMIQDIHVIALPANAPPGVYTLQVGWYLLESGERLPVDEANTDYVTLGPVFLDIEPGQKEKPDEAGR